MCTIFTGSLDANLFENSLAYQTGSQVATPPHADEALKAAIAALRDAVVVQAEPGAQREQAMEQVDALGRAAETDPPNGHALVAARNWFRSNLPSVASALGPVLLHPTVETAIDAAVELMRNTTPGQSHPEGAGWSIHAGQAARRRWRIPGSGTLSLPQRVDSNEFERSQCAVSASRETAQ